MVTGHQNIYIIKYIKPTLASRRVHTKKVSTSFLENKSMSYSVVLKVVMGLSEISKNLYLTTMCMFMFLFERKGY